MRLLEDGEKHIMADTVKVTKLGRRRRGRNTLRNIGARDVDKERSARIVAKKAVAGTVSVSLYFSKVTDSAFLCICWQTLCF